MRQRHTHLFCHVVPVLSTMHAAGRGSGPGGRIDGGALVLGTLDRLPVHQERDRVLRLGNAVVGRAGGNARRGAGHHAGGVGLVLQHPAAYIDVVAGQIVGDIRVLACPRSECVQLRFGLGHPCREKVELAQRV